MKTTLYQLLGVAANAAAADIAAAYGNATRSPAADTLDPGARGLLRQAFEVLSDPARRAAYDATLANDIGDASGYVPHPAAAATSSFGAGTWIVIAGAIAAVIGATALWTAHRPAAKAPVSPTTAVPAKIEAAKAARPDSVAPGSDAPAVPAVPEPSAASATTSEAEPSRAGAPDATRPPQPDAAGTRVPDPGAMPSVSVRPATATSTPAGSAETVFADVSASVARVNVLDASERSLGTGSGVVIEPGVIVTSCHVAKAGPKLTVKLGEVVLPATIRLADEEYDLCRLHVPGLHAPPVRIGSVASLRTGQQVFAIGAPAGLELTISEGIVSSLRKVDEGTLIQTTAPISPGSSGGGLFDASSRLVGIMTFQHRFGQNLNFALPADWIGPMRQRAATAASWRTAAVGGRGSNLIVGQWLCRDWISGRTGRYTFRTDGRVSIAMSDFPELTLNYGVSGNSLQFFDSQKAITLEIGELTSSRLIFKGTDRNIACER